MEEANGDSSVLDDNGTLHELGSLVPEIVIKDPNRFKSLLGGTGGFNPNTSNIYRTVAIPAVGIGGYRLFGEQ